MQPLAMVTTRGFMSVFVRHSDSSHGFKAIKNQIIALMATLLLNACATIPVEERATHRQKINTRADNTISALVAKKPEEFGKAMLMTVMVETYAVLSLLISFLLVNGVKIG